MHHLLTLDPPPADLGITSRQRVAFATCLSCLGWEESTLAYAHDDHGDPRALTRLRSPRLAPRFPAGPLKRTQAAVVPASPRWQFQDWGLADDRQNLHRVGGEPTWVQAAAYPDCPRCHLAMRFVFQLDSDLPTDDEGGRWLWGSGGIGYFFWCDPCAVSAGTWQCT